MGMDATELARWTRFAAKGGIGKCTAVCDCVAESSDDLMFLKDDEITVLMQIPELEGWFLGHCEGVVGRFQGAHVHFLSKLKKPVMTKRTSSITSSSAAKSPTPSSGFKSPSPGPHSSSSLSRPGSLSRRESDSLPRRSSSQARPHVGSVGAAHFQMSAIHTEEEQRGQQAGNSASSGSSTGDDSAIVTPPLHAFPPPPNKTGWLEAEVESESRRASPIRGVSPPPASQNEPAAGPVEPPARVSSYSATVEPPVRTSSHYPALVGPPVRTSSHIPSEPTTHTPPPHPVAVEAPVHVSSLLRKEKPHAPPAPLVLARPFSENTALAPRPADISPLTITKRAGGVGTPVSPAFVGQHEQPEPEVRLHPAPQVPPGESSREHEHAYDKLAKPLLPAPLPSALYPDTSVSFASYDQRVSLALSDGEVGIGLSLLQDLAGGMGTDSGSEYDGEDREGRWEGAGEGSEKGGRGGGERDSGTVEGLMYGGEESEEDEGHGGDTTTSGDNTLNSIHGITPRAPQVPSPPPQPPQTQPEPLHQTHTATLSPHSPTSPTFMHRPIPERRPSLAPSTSTANTNNEWEGADDIYDDYRYSRFSAGSKASRLSAGSKVSVGSKVSRFSVGSRVGGGGGQGREGEAPPVPDGRGSLDRGAGRGTGEGAGRGSYEGTARGSFEGVGRGGIERERGQHPLREEVQQDSYDGSSRNSPAPGSTGANGRPPSSQAQPRDSSTPPSQSIDPFAPARPRHLSLDSDASVYTQASRLSTLSREVMDVLSPNVADTPTTDPSSITDTPTTAIPGTGSRPAPLNLAAGGRSPLLHTTWGSPLSSPGEGMLVSPASSSFFITPTQGRVPSLTAVAGVTVPAPARSPPPGVGPANSPPPGMATALRQRIEIDRKHSPSPFPSSRDSTSVTHAGDGLGGRIVIEDEEELPSRIVEDSRDLDDSRGLDDLRFLDDSRDIHASPEPEGVRDQDSSPEPEPEILARGRLAPLVIANRTPSPIGRDGDEEDEDEDEQKVEQPTGEESGWRAAGTAEQEVVSREWEGRVLQRSPPTITSPRSSSSLPFPAVVPPAATAVQPPPPPATSSSLEVPPPSHLRPSLADLRGDVQVIEGQRRSLFLPHPNAPKAPTASSPGPMYIASQQTQQTQAQQQRTEPARPSAIAVLHMALNTPPRGPPPMMQGRAPLPPRGPTIYGKTEIDLSVAMGPVPIVFSIDPLPANTPPPPPASNAPMRVTPSPLRASTMPRASVASTMGGKAIATGSDRGSVASGTESLGPGGAGMERSASPAGGVIPRANFFPKAAGGRPRSRSFSGFNSTNAEIPLPVQKSREEGSKPLAIPTAGEVKESLSIFTSPSSPTSSSSPSTSLSAPSSPKAAPKTSPLRPSPLSLSSASGGLRPAATTLKSPTSPLAQSIIMPPPPNAAISSVPSSPAPSVLSNRPHNLKQVTSRSTLQETSSPRQPTFPRPPIVNTGESSASSMSSPPSVPNRSASMQGQTAASSTGTGRPSTDDDAASIRSSRSQLTSPPPTIIRQTSLRSKLSLPNLRRNRSRQEEAVSITSANPPPDSEMLQVQDMDFELVRPNLGRFEAARTSEDSGVLGRDGSVDLRSGTDPALLRTDSPSMSISSGGGASGFSVPRSPIAEGPGAGSWGARSSPSASAPVSRVTTDSESSMDAHRQREAKWMSLLSSTPPAQARKSKKVKKLVLEGVPSSVRYLVWSMLTDGKARVVPGIYTQLGARGRVVASSEIERDIQVCFNDQPHLRKTEGPVLALLQAYLTMVPDVRYTRGLTLIAGQLLLLSPEEDAFWIFVSIMDTHIRPYFSPSTTQMEVDSALFSRALENNDSQVAKKILVDMGVTPSAICLPWFSSLFVGCLPPDHLNRVWDIFLYEGVPFLLRVGLAVVSCCRRQILDCTSEELLLSHLRSPSPGWLPPTPDAFLSLTFSVKLKDDDMRKQRIKMEAQVKRQTQVPRMASAPGLISLPRP